MGEREVENRRFGMGGSSLLANRGSLTMTDRQHIS